MCGIAGFVSYDGLINCSSTRTVLTAALAHRGPDGSGHVGGANAVLCHTRLSIIDPVGGHQPMSTDDQQLHLTYNGEIYNYRELRQELQRLGCLFLTNSDTEVLLHAYRQWGRHCVHRLEGMFAFAVLDLRKRELLLARDHFGIKPLLYRVAPESLAFASELQALRSMPDWSGEIDFRAIDLFLRYQYIPAPLTAFRNVFKLPAGHCMVVSLDQPGTVLERYWRPDFSRKRRRSESQLQQETDECLRDSVRRHLVADVPFGAFLSGGIDSSLVVSYMAELLDQPVRTFSIGFDDQQFSELDFARQVAKKYRTDHHEQMLDVDAFSVLPELVRHYGEPYGDQSAIATWAVCRLARQHVPMVLSGDGGDEFFAGYGTYGNWQDSGVATRNVSLSGRFAHVARKVRHLGRRKSGVHRYQPDPLVNWYALVGRFNQPLLRSSLWRPELRFVSDLPDDAFQRAFAETTGWSRINQAQFLDLQTFLPEDILTKVDIASMAVGLEVRPPILDRRVFELAASIPEEQLHAQRDGYCGKLPLKKLAAARFGNDFAFRRKQGFEIPLERWLRGTPERKAQVLQRLTDPDVGLGAWFCNTAVRNVVEHGTPYNLWLLCILQEWRLQNFGLIGDR